MDAYLDNVKAFLGRLSAGQKIALASVLVGGLLVFGGIAYWAGQTDYALLFGSLAPGEASKIVETLQSENVEYELRDGGSGVYVPREKVYELRLRFAGEGMISDGTTGYELFDTGTLGMTDFMQKLNMRRALEGELSRTITSLRNVDLARVHLVIPERSPFQATQSTPTASVVLQLSSGARPSSEQIQGIVSLVSGAVEGLEPAGVTVVDTRGTMLSNPDAGDEALALSTNQLRMQHAVEQHLTEKGQSMLDQVMGPGNSIVRVTATLDFDRAVTERDIIDPESQTVVSEEKLDEEGDGLAANSAVKNYELSRTRERHEKSTGSIAYLTVSVIVNKPPGEPTLDEDGNPVPSEPVELDERQLAEVQELVKNAVGFNDDRGDRLAIHQTVFDTSALDQLENEIQQERFDRNLDTYLRYGLGLLALVLVFWLVRSISQRAMVVTGREEAPGQLGEGAEGQLGPGERVGADGQPLLGPGQPAEDDEFVLVDDVYTSKLSKEAKARLKAKHAMFEEIRQSVVDRPDDAAELIRNWLASDDEDVPA